MFEELTLIYFDLKYRTFSKELHMHHFFSFNGFFIAAYYNKRCVMIMVKQLSETFGK
jgi:hypothetical protein